MSALDKLPLELARHRVLGTKAAAEFIGLSLRTFNRLRGRKAVPDYIKISDRKLGWRIGDLMDLLDCRERGREWRDCKGAQGTGAAAP